jgi:GTPase SAR1 family protein
MPTFEEFFSVFREFLPLLTAGGVAVSAAGLIPRIGPGRAVWIALRSRFAFKPVPESLRSAEIKLLKSRIADKDFGQGYLVVTGEKGVGKTCLMNTVTSKTVGVITVEAQPGHTQDTIIKNTLLQLADPPFNFMSLFKAAPRVIFWYRLFTFGRSPIVVINATERNVGEGYAGLTGAVRTLVDKYKLRVVVDGSPNSLDESLLRTKRQRVVDIKPMTKELIWQIEQLQDLFKYVEEVGLDDIVFAVLGGIPAGYEELWDNARIDLQDGQEAREVLGSHLCSEISAAIKIVKDSKTKTNDMEEIIKLFDKNKKLILSDTLTVKKLQRPTPDKVFRELEQDGVFVLVPASNAIGIVLQHSLIKEPSLNELEVMVRPKV